MQNNKKRILFIKSVINSSMFSFDFGIGLLSAVLKQEGYSVSLFIIQSLDQLKELDRRIENYKPDVIAFSVFASSFASSCLVSKHIRSKYPKMHQIMGGVHMILDPQGIKFAKHVDAICTGEGEHSLVDYLYNFFNSKKYHLTKGFWVRYKSKIFYNPPFPVIQDLDSLPFPDRQIFFEQNVSGSIFENTVGLEFLFTRGCPFNCPYCANHGLKKAYGNGKYVRSLSPKRAIELILHDCSLYKADHITIHDDTFTLNKRWLFEFLEYYREKVKIPFMCNVRVDTLNKEILQLLRKSGCFMIKVGVESGDQYVRNIVLRRKMEDKAIIDVFKGAKEIGLRTMAYVMMGLPEEDPKRFLETVKFVNKIQPDIISMAVFYPYPGTELYEICSKNKWIKKQDPLHFIERENTVLSMPKFSTQDIRYYYQNFFELVKCGGKTDFSLKYLHRKIKYALLSVPPSSHLHKLTKTAISLDDYLIKIIFTFFNFT